MGSSAVQTTEPEEDLSQLTFEQRLARQPLRVRKFIFEYPKDLSGKYAAIRAGCPDRGARQRAYEMLADNEVWALIEILIERMTKEAELRTLEVLRQLRVMVNSNIDDYSVDAEGVVKLKEGVPEEAMQAVSSVKRRFTVRTDKDGSTTETVEVELKLWSKPEATRQAGEYLKMFKGPLELPAGLIGGVLAIPVQMEEPNWEAAAITQQSSLSKLAAGSIAGIIPPKVDSKSERTPAAPLTTVML